MSKVFFNRHYQGKLSLFRSIDLLLLLGFSSFLIFCVTPNSTTSVKSNATAKPSADKVQSEKKSGLELQTKKPYQKARLSI